MSEAFKLSKRKHIERRLSCIFYIKYYVIIIITNHDNKIASFNKIASKFGSLFLMKTIKSIKFLSRMVFLIAILNLYVFSCNLGR
jgi:hypothetical protein